MKLCHFPNLLKGFWVIDSDQSHPDGKTGNPIPAAEVPETWLERFKLLEAILVKSGDMTPRQLGIPAEDLTELDVADEPVWNVLCMPGNDDDSLVLAKLGYSPEEIENIRSVYCEFFDGFELESLRVQ